MGWLGDLWDDFTGKSAAKTAAKATTAATKASIAEQRREFDIMQEALAPYTEAGEQALQNQLALSGALGADAQAEAINMIQSSPGYTSALESGERSILQNAAATGGLRGGNTQAALAQYSPQLLQSAIDQRYSQLGGLSQLGQASAAGVGSAAVNTGQGISNALMNAGNTQAASALAANQLKWNAISGLPGLVSDIKGLF